MTNFSITLALVTSCILLAFSPQIVSTFVVIPHSSIRSISLLASTKDDADNSTPIPSTGEKHDSTSHDQLMYALGVNLARQIGDIRPIMENSLELSQVARGLLDTVVGKLSEVEQRALLKIHGKEINDLITQRAEKIQQKAEAAGRSMLKTMSETEGVQILPSGTCLHILEYGPEGPNSGLRPTAASSVKVHYHGTLADGTIFDSTLGMDPVSFAVGKVIPGWKEALLRMHEGETAMIGVPPEQAYGSEGSGDGRVPGGSALFFKVQLLEVLSAGLGGTKLIGLDGKKLKKDDSSILLGADGKPLFSKK